MNVFDLCATLSLDSTEYEKGLNESESTASKIGSKIGSALGTTAKAIGAGLVASATGIATLVKSSTEAYADYEQLVGGVDTLFGEAGEKVKEYANVAYSTAGLSANEYMETVTSFSASLLQSLDNDTEASADKANQAIIDMADNANKMGTSMESIQNAYQGFAKQNYTMLDNLKLGYGGTKEEMERLLEDASKISGQDYSIDSYADIVDAIHEVQDAMGIAGATKDEALTTISGSINALKSAWTNLVTGLADENADLDTLIDNLISSAETALTNIEPVLEKALDGIADVIVKVVPIISEKLPDIINDLLPRLLDSATVLLNGIVSALPTLIQIVAEQAPTIIEKITDALVENLPMLIDCAFLLIEGLAKGLIKAIPKILEAIPQIWNAMDKKFLEWENKIKDVGKNLIEGLWNGINDKVTWITDKIKGFTDKVLESIKGFFGIHSPSTVMRDQVGKMLAEGVGEGWEEGFEDIKDDMNADLDFDLNTNSQAKAVIRTDAGSDDYDENKLSEAIRNALDSYTIEWNDRNLGRLVRTYA